MKRIKLPKKSLSKQRGAAIIEYGLIVALIALIAIAAITLIGQHSATLFNTVSGTL